MDQFRLICCQCGSDNVLEKSGVRQVDWLADRVRYGEGIERQCLDCNNESFVIFKTWLK